MALDLFSNLATVTEGFVPSQPTTGPDDFNPPVSGPPATDRPADLPSGGPTCEVCGVELPYSGKGRKPKFCMDHKTRTKSTAGSDGPAVSRSTVAGRQHQARLDAIVGDLQQGVGELAGTIVPVAPVTAATLVLQGPAATEALVRIAADHPRMLDGLEAAAKAVPFVAVGKFVAAIVLALAVDMGRMQPYGVAAEYLRVAEAAEQVGWQPPVEESPDGDTRSSNNYSNTPPPAFKLVG